MVELEQNHLLSSGEKELFVADNKRNENGAANRCLDQKGTFTPTSWGIRDGRYRPWWLFTAYEKGEYRGFGLFGCKSPPPPYARRLYLIEIRVDDDYEGMG